MFTKQHYDEIARILCHHKPNPDNDGKIYWQDIVKEFTMALYYDNRRFNEEKFIRACNNKMFV